MKKLFYTLLVCAITGAIIISCENKEDNEEPLVFTGQLVSNSICKNDLKSSTQFVETPDSLSCIEYSFDTDNNKLTIRHINAGFNCCPDSLYCQIELKGDTILVKEFEKTAQCHCLCLYDLNIEVTGVEQKSYQLKFMEPYAEGLDVLLVEVDLMKELNGTFSVTRKQYPWGMGNIY